MTDTTIDGTITCPDCAGRGRHPGFDTKVDGIWTPPICERCAGRGTLYVTISGDSERYYVTDDDGREVGIFRSLADSSRRMDDAAPAMQSGDTKSQEQP